MLDEIEDNIYYRIDHRKFEIHTDFEALVPVNKVLDYRMEGFRAKRNLSSAIEFGLRRW